MWPDNTTGLVGTGEEYRSPAIPLLSLLYSPQTLASTQFWDKRQEGPPLTTPTPTPVGVVITLAKISQCLLSKCTH